VPEQSAERGVTYLVVVPLPDAAPLVAPWRHTNRLGAHVTLLAPWTTAPLHAATRQRFARRLAREPQFCVTLHSLGWFDDRVVYLQPDQGPRWAELARVAAHALGRDATDAPTTPHVTVAKGLGRDELERAASLTSARLPWAAVVRHAVLHEFDRAAGRWRPLVRVTLAASPATSHRAEKADNHRG
jgi:2'-5' RNA ligase